MIGEGWFADSGVEKVVVPASVRELKKYSFMYCEKLKRIEFAGESRLEKIS